jgi:thermitase
MNSTMRRALAGAVALAAAAIWAGPDTVHAASRGRARYVEGEVIVKFKRGVYPSLMGAVAARGNAQASIAKRMVDPVTGRGNPSVALARFPKTLSVDEMVARYRALPEVAYAEPNYIATKAELRGTHDRSAEPAFVTRRTSLDGTRRVGTQRVSTADLRSLALTYPIDPQLYSQWGWTWVSADIVWPDTKAAMVAVVDTGVDAQHPDLMGQVINGFDFVNNDAIANDDDGHGTHVAGILAAKNNDKNGIAGVSRGKIYAVKVLDASGAGTYFDVALGIHKAADYAPVKVINVSLGGSGVSDTLQGAVEYATLVKGKLLVAAAGNDGVTTKFYPAGYSNFAGPSVIGLGAIDLSKKILSVGASGTFVTGSTDGLDYFVEYCRAPYSNYGDWVNITAPGTEIYSTTPYKKEFYGARYFGDSLDGYNTYSGTSMAAPHVAAVAARVWGNNLTFTNVAVADRVLDRGFASQVGDPIDVDEDLTPDLAECWESGNDPVGIGPGFLVDVNAATALGRGRVSGRIMDATTGLGVTGAVASLVKGATMVGFGGGLDGVGVSFYDIINVPWNDPGSGPVAPSYKLRISKAGYTVGPQVVLADDPTTPLVNEGIILGISPVDPGGPFELDKLVTKVSVPPSSANYTFVTDWGVTDTTTELDGYLFVPLKTITPLPTGGCSVGFDQIAGDCGGSGGPGSTGSLLAYPFARWFRDGGPTDGLGTEAHTARSPLQSTANGNYVFAVNDAQNGDGTGFLEADADPIVRLWKGGVVKTVVRFASRTLNPLCTADGGPPLGSCDFWKVGEMTSAGVFSSANMLDDGAVVIPYRVGGGGTRITVRPGGGSRSESGSGTQRTSQQR